MQSVASSSCDYNEVHCASIDYNDGTDATSSTAATQAQTSRSVNAAAAEWKRKYEKLSLAAQQATLALTSVPGSAPIAALS